MESFWLDIETALKIRDASFVPDEESRRHVEMCRDRDLKYSSKTLPKNFYEDFLMTMPVQFPLSLEFWR